jgi:phosphoribosylamine--glycine ligase
MVGQERRELNTIAGFSAGVVLTVPPFPYSYGYTELSKGLPILLHSSLTDENLSRLHLAEVAMQGTQLVTSGCSGYVGVATGIGSTVDQARASAYELARKVVVPNLRYRVDIGERVARHELARLKSLGYVADHEWT